MTKRLYCLWALIISILFSVSSCMKDDATSSYTTYEDTAITSFTLGTVKVSRYVGKKKYAKDADGNPVDSFFTYNYSGSKTPVYIDQLTKEIYNTDSLPAGSHMKMLATVNTKNYSSMSYRDWDAADDATWTRYNSGDSIVFGEDRADSKALRFRVWATQGDYICDYKVLIVSHKEYADSFQYVTLAPQTIFADAEKLKGAATYTGVYVMAKKGTENKLYCGSNYGSSWTEKKTFGSEATMAEEEGQLYVLDNNIIYHGDGTTWDEVDVSAHKLKMLLGGSNGSLFAINEDGKIVEGQTSEIASWTSADAWTVDEVYGNEELLPTKDICSASVDQRVNTNVSRITIIGNKASYTEKGDTCAVVWNKNVGSIVEEKWVYNDPADSKIKSLALPAMENLSATPYYNGWILAIGGKGLNAATPLVNKPYQRMYCSEDGGTSWHKLAGLRMPDLTLSSDKPTLIIADVEGYFYIISADGGKVYRCKLNNATWKSTDYQEYKED